jgi:outer membrane protein, heavy metal efflux system
MNRKLIRRAALGAALATIIPCGDAAAQQASMQGSDSAIPLTLSDAIDRARRNHPDIRAAVEVTAAAAARERQAAAWPNPAILWSHEQVSAPEGRSAEDIVRLEQPLPIGGQRAARRDATRLRREAAEQRLRALEAQLAFEVTRAYALAAAAEGRAALADEAATQFARAYRVSEQRLAAGDVSGYAHRRLGLEAARYGVLRATSALDVRAARLALAALIASAADSIAPLAARITLADSLLASSLAGTGTGPRPDLAGMGVPDTLLSAAYANRAELRAVQLEADAAAAEAQLAGRSRIPVPALSAGVKREQLPGVAERASGLAAGVALPLPLWDRGGGTVAAAEAESRRAIAAAESVRRQTAREVVEAYEGVRATLEQMELLRSSASADDQRLALRAAQVAYAEGEISLLEWLDAVRAYQETQAEWTTLHAAAAIRRAELARATGTPPGTAIRGGSER